MPSEFSLALVSKLNKRACFDKLYDQVGLRLRDNAALRQQVSDGARVGLMGMERWELQKQERLDAEAFEQSLPMVPWWLQRRNLCQPGSRGAEISAEHGTGDWRGLAVERLDTRVWPRNLFQEITRRYGRWVELCNSLRLRVDSLQQKERELDGLAIYYAGLTGEIESLIKQIREQEGWVGKILMVPTSLLSGWVHAKDNAGQTVNMEMVALPLIQSVMILKSVDEYGHATGARMMVVWFSNDFGIPVEVEAFMRTVDWDNWAEGH